MKVWTQFKEAVREQSTVDVDQLARVTGKTPEEIRRCLAQQPPGKIWLNNQYQVIVRENGRGMAWLSIRHLDKSAVRNVDDFQRIKNALIGPENEGAELFPAESRLVDGANQYHLFVHLDPRFRFPFGFNDAAQKDALIKGAATCMARNEPPYVVNYCTYGQPDDGIGWLRIRRMDGQPATDWRALQHLKNCCIGSEAEAIELYPAESRRAAMAGEHHLWAVLLPNFRFPFGFRERLVTDQPVAGTRQREFAQNG